MIERFRDELGDWRVCVLTPFGAKVHAPWSMALQRSLTNRVGFETQVMYSEDGIVLRGSNGDGSGGKLRLRAIVVRPSSMDDLEKRASLLRRDSVHGALRAVDSPIESSPSRRGAT